MNSDELTNSLKRKIAASVRYELGTEESMMATKVMVTIEIADEGGGMIVRYHEPMKSLRKAMRQGFNLMNDPGIQAFLVTLLEVTGGGEEDDSWKGSKAERIKKSIEKLTSIGQPKDVEEYCWEQKTMVCKTAEDLMAAIEIARKARDKGKDLERDGKHVRHRQQYYGGESIGVGEAYMAAPSIGPIPPMADFDAAG